MTVPVINRLLCGSDALVVGVPGSGKTYGGIIAMILLALIMDNPEMRRKLERAYGDSAHWPSFGDQVIVFTVQNNTVVDEAAARFDALIESRKAEYPQITRINWIRSPRETWALEEMSPKAFSLTDYYKGYCVFVEYLLPRWITKGKREFAELAKNIQTGDYSCRDKQEAKRRGLKYKSPDQRADAAEQLVKLLNEVRTMLFIQQLPKECPPDAQNTPMKDGQPRWLAECSRREMIDISNILKRYQGS